MTALKAIIVVVASFAFPTAALLFLIGGPKYRDRRREDR